MYYTGNTVVKVESVSQKRSSTHNHDHANCNFNCYHIILKQGAKRDGAFILRCMAIGKGTTMAMGMMGTMGTISVEWLLLIEQCTLTMDGNRRDLYSMSHPDLSCR